MTFQTALINHHLLADWWNSLQQCGFYISRSELPHWLALCLCPLSFLSCVPYRLKSQWAGPQRPVFQSDHPPALWGFLSWVSSHEICLKSARGFLQFGSVHLAKSVPFRWGSYWDYLDACGLKVKVDGCDGVWMLHKLDLPTVVSQILWNDWEHPKS